MKQTNNYKITDLNSLNRRIDTLYERKEEIENKLEDNWAYLQENYVHLIRNSILKKIAVSQKNSFLNGLLSIPKVQDAVSSITEKIITGIENLLLKLMNKLTS